jgi:hypothetical protein
LRGRLKDLPLSIRSIAWKAFANDTASAGGSGFTTAEIQSTVVEALGSAPDHYTLASLRHDLSKFRAKGFVAKLPKSRRYQLLPQGHSICLIFLKRLGNWPRRNLVTNSRRCSTRFARSTPGFCVPGKFAAFSSSARSSSEVELRSSWLAFAGVHSLHLESLPSRPRPGMSRPARVFLRVP